MKMIFLGEAARDSGSFGFSEAWPLERIAVSQWIQTDDVCPNRKNLPTSPDGMDVHALGNIHNQLDVGIVVVIRAAGHLDVVVGHANVVGVCL